MDKHYRLAHLIGPTLRNRRLELGISEDTIFEKTSLKISEIEKSSDLHYNDFLMLCKIYDLTLNKFYAAVEDLHRSQEKY
jgi:hypothetical protein